ncbi:MAG TPA: DUF2934 domain-containing protein [Gemmataceae bacterium]|nr:DUF2934 domain-containing protein [Gemmataceae bacterium]
MATKYRDRPRNRPPAAPQRPTPDGHVPEISLQPGQEGERDHGALEDVIRTRAYYLWEQAGRPDGDGAEFWFEAEREIGNPN